MTGFLVLRQRWTKRLLLEIRDHRGAESSSGRGS